MTLGVRAKLFIVSIALVVAVVLASGFYLRGELRGLLEKRIESELRHNAQAVAAMMETTSAARTIDAIDPLCDRLGVATETRVTVVASDGQLLCDSELTPTEVASAQNHSTRPEVVEALAHGVGSSRRWSTTVETHMLYVAVAFRLDDAAGVARSARPLKSVDETLGRLRFLLLVAGLVGLLVAIAMSGLASHLMSRTLRTLVENARAIAGGRERRRLDVTSGDELAGLAGSLNQLAEDLETTVAELAAERARFRDVLEGLGEAVIAIDPDREVTLMNRAATELLGLPTEPLGSPILELVRAPALQELIATPITAGSAEFDLPGTSQRVLARIAPLRAGAGAVLIMHTVTELRRLETIRRDFVANVSHELRTPVSIIRANTETLLDGAMDDPVHGVRLLTSAHRNAERLSTIIADLLDLSRIEAGRYPVEAQRVDIAEAVALAIGAAIPSGDERVEQVEVDVTPGLTASADAKAFEQILVNYLENATKYTAATEHIQIVARAVNGSVRIEVRDDGPGIDARHRRRVFERFYRIDPGRSRDMGGTGLGLSIVKNLAEAMDGEVGVEPNAPRGSIFWVTLPAAK